jgi:hypothetical protein
LEVQQGDIQEMSLADFFKEKNEPSSPFPITDAIREVLIAATRIASRAPDTIIIDSVIYGVMQKEIAKWRRHTPSELFGLTFEGLPIESVHLSDIPDRDIQSKIQGELILVFARMDWT